jgi:chaperonin GroES
MHPERRWAVQRLSEAALPSISRQTKQINPALPLDSGISVAIIGSHKGRVLTLTPPTTRNSKQQESCSMKIRPLHDRVIVKREEEERKSPGGIVIPDTATEKPIFGKVVAVGKGKILENGEVRPLDVKVGDKILFGKYSGTEVKMDGDELVVMREEDVMAVVEGK